MRRGVPVYATFMRPRLRIWRAAEGFGLTIEFSCVSRTLHDTMLIRFTNPSQTASVDLMRIHTDTHYIQADFRRTVPKRPAVSKR